MASGGGEMGRKGPNLNQSQRDKLERLEKRIMSHFQRESESLTKYFIAEDNLDNMKNNMAKSLGQADQATKEYIKTLIKQKDGLMQDTANIQSQRNDILDVYPI